MKNEDTYLLSVELFVSVASLFVCSGKMVLFDFIKLFSRHFVIQFYFCVCYPDLHVRDSCVHGQGRAFDQEDSTEVAVCHQRKTGRKDSSPSLLCDT